MSQVVAILDGILGESVHTIADGTPHDLYLGGSPTGDTIESPRKNQQVVAVKATGTNPIYIGGKNTVTSTRYIWKVSPSDIQATMISVNANLSLWVIGTAADTYVLTRFF